MNFCYFDLFLCKCIGTYSSKGTITGVQRHKNCIFSWNSNNLNWLRKNDQNLRIKVCNKNVLLYF